MPLEDCTKSILQERNVVLPSKVRPQHQAALTAKTSVYTHDPYANVLPNEHEYREIMQQVQLQQQQIHQLALMQAFFALQQQQLQLQQQQQLQRAALEQSPQPTAAKTCVSALQAPKSPTQGSAHLTKVYQNGRPVPTLREAYGPGEVEEHPEPLPPRPITGPVLASITFRRSSGKFLISDVATLVRVSNRAELVGLHVFVDGDRGCDLGCITAIETATESDIPKPAARSVKRRTDEDEQPTGTPTVQRLATAEEVRRYQTTQRSDEQAALAFAVSQATKLLTSGPKLTIVDAVFQFDRNKLTLYYLSDERVYFVPLLKALNQQYKCRIWMERADEESAQ